MTGFAKIVGGMALSAAACSLPAPHASAQSLPLDFQGKMLVSVSDADMEASAYATDRLGKAEGRDALSVIRLGGDVRDLTAHEVEVSNAVVGPPAVLALSPDGRYAIVVETLKQRSAGVDRLSQMLPGNAIAVVDLSDAERPKVVQRIAAPGAPGSVSINADGSLVAVTLLPGKDGTARPLLLYPFRNGRLDEAVAAPLPDWNPSDRLMDASFHPTQNILVLVNATGKQLSFVRIAGESGALSVTPWGNPVGISSVPYIARFTADGRHVITNATYSGPDVLDGGFSGPMGALISVRVDYARAEDGAPRHALVSMAQTGSQPEAFAISPDGRMIVSINNERTALPFDDPRLTSFSTLTLLRFDPDSGVLTRVDDFAYDGVLPENLVFDNSGKFLAVTTFDHFDDRKSGGSVDFWRIANDRGRTFLVKTDHSVKVTRGVHTMAIVR